MKQSIQIPTIAYESGTVAASSKLQDGGTSQIKVPSVVTVLLPPKTVAPNTFLLSFSSLPANSS